MRDLLVCGAAFGAFALGAVCLGACASSDRGLTRSDAGGPVEAGSIVISGNDGAVTPVGGAEVFGHSDTALYRLDPESKAVTVVGNFQGCYDILDIALDEDSNMYGASETALYAIDKRTATCTLLKEGSKYPNSLSFVPKGTVDANVEALVGFVDSAYYRIDTSTGVKTPIGTMGSNYRSSGDIVSVKGGGTYVTVLGSGCHDCLVEIDPRNGSIKKNFGPLGYQDVFGLTFWAGSAYGFTNGGQLFEIKFGATSVTTSVIPVPNAPSGLKFWGAGSTTAAPLTIR
ncbi:MAG: hypothetical protein U0235_34420 [Polyangiaceae bacterium]